METTQTPDFGIFLPLGPHGMRAVADVAARSCAGVEAYLEGHGIRDIRLQVPEHIGVTLARRQEVSEYMSSLAGELFDFDTFALRIQKGVRPLEPTITPLARLTNAVTDGRSWSVLIDRNPNDTRCGGGARYIRALRSAVYEASIADDAYPLPLTAGDRVTLFEYGLNAQLDLSDEQQQEIRHQIAHNFRQYGRREVRFGRLAVGHSMLHHLPGTEPGY